MRGNTSQQLMTSTGGCFALLESYAPFLDYKRGKFPIAFRGKTVVHMQAHTRTHGSVHAYTCKCTCVHCHVYDGIAAEKNREMLDLQLEKCRVGYDVLS